MQNIVSLDPKEVGRRLAAARLRKHWTQLEFAINLGVSPASISRWERGYLPPVRELMRIADVLEIEPAELVKEHTEHEELLAEISELRAEIAQLRAEAKEREQPKKKV